MKITKQTLKRIIREELEAVVSEASDLDSFYGLEKELEQEQRESIKELLDSDDPSIVDMGIAILDSFEINGKLFYEFWNYLKAYNNGIVTTKEMKSFLKGTFSLDEESAEKAMETLRGRQEFPMIDPAGSSEKLYQQSKKGR